MKDNMLSVTALPPVIRQGAESYVETLQTEKEKYTISDLVGFDQASFTLTGPPDYLIDWYENGLVRDVMWRDPDGGTCWNGYVKRLVLTVGDRTLTKSVDDMANRVVLYYTPLDTAENPPTAGAKTSTTKNDTTSQALYGIKTTLVSGSECTAATADDLALAHLSWTKQIASSEVVTVGMGKQPALQVEMNGYAHMANWYVYSQTVNTGTDNASTILGLILADDPNSVLATSTVNIDTNTTATEEYWDGSDFAWKIVQELAMRGQETGSVGYRWACGIYENRRTTFKAAEGLDDDGVPYSTNRYLALHRQIYDAGNAFIDEAGREWLPWQLRPDRLLYTEGVPGRPMYIEKVQFYAPDRVTLSGTDRVDPLGRLIKGYCE